MSGFFQGLTASASVPASPPMLVSSPIFHGPSCFQRPVVPFGGMGGGGGGGGGGGASELQPTLVLPGECATVRLSALSQHAPLLNVEKRQPRFHQTGLRHAARHG